MILTLNIDITDSSTYNIFQINQDFMFLSTVQAEAEAFNDFQFRPSIFIYHYSAILRFTNYSPPWLGGTYANI